MVEQLDAQPNDIKGIEQARLIAQSEKRVLETLDALDHEAGQENQDLKSFSSKDSALLKPGRNALA